MQKNLSGITAGAVIFGMIIAQSISEEMGKAGQPPWLRVVVSAVVAGCLAGGIVYLAGRSAKK